MKWFKYTSEKIDVMGKKLTPDACEPIVEYEWEGSGAKFPSKALDKYRGTNRLRVIRIVEGDFRKIPDYAFDGLESVEELYLSENQIEKIEHLDPMVNLKRLHLGGNLIETMEGLDGLINLEDLSLANNPIHHFSAHALKNLKKLKVLTLFGCDIENENEIKKFKKDHPKIDAFF